MTTPNTPSTTTADASPQTAPAPSSIAPDPAWRYSFFGLLRRLNARHPDQPRIGHALRAQDEFVRLGQKPSLVFAPREVADITQREGRTHVRAFGLGLLGPNGAMPLHVTEFVRERSESYHDSTLADFLDIFHHRYLSSLYRAWDMAQSAASLDRPNDERFSGYINALSNTESAHNHVLPSHARLSAAPHLVRQARNADGLAGTLTHFFEVPIEVREFIPRWIDIDIQDQSQLGRPGPSSMLGDSAFAGRKMIDRQHQLRIVIGPLNLEQYLSFTPIGHNLPLLREWVRAFVGFEFAWEVQLNITPSTVPVARMGGPDGLGWSTWLGQPDPDHLVTGMTFEPEAAS